MNFISTRGGDKVTGAQAIVKGLAENGGLFVPEKLPKISKEDLEKMAEMGYAERVAFVLGKFFADELGEGFLAEICDKAYASFTAKDPVPLVKVDGQMYMLELFHGPTCAFEDMSLTLFPALLKKSCEVTGTKEDILLIATGGDVCKSALEAFSNKPGVKVAAFYPDESVSKMQRFLLSVQGGKNVSVVAVEGNVDDCQRAAKRMFMSEDFNAQLAERKTRLCSADSINFARIAPQITYYFSAYLDLLTSGQIEEGEEVDFVMPVGTFGPVLAGWYAKNMGLPIRKLVCASNRNRAVAEFFKTGVYNAKREVVRTMSPSLDSAVASDIERLIFEISGRNAKQTATRMQELADNKEYTITQKEKSILDESFFASFATEDDTVEAMYDVFDEYGYVMDTHTGVSLAAKEKYRYEVEKENKKDKTAIVVFSVGNPYKAPQDVLYALSGNDVKDSYKGVKRLHLLTAMKPPKSIVDARYKPIRFKTKVKNKVKDMAELVLRFVDGEVVPEPKEE